MTEEAAAAGHSCRPLDAIVTDVHLRNAVAGLRDLGRAGLAVAAVAPTRVGAGLWSRYAAARLVGPDGLAEGRELAAELAGVVRRGGHEAVVLYPAREEAVDALLDHAGELPAEAIVPYSGPDALRCLRDKRRLPDLAAGVGLAAPRTIAEATAQELLALEPIPVPCVVKQAHPERRTTIGGSLVFKDEPAFRAALTELPEDEPLLVQEHMSGGLISLGLVVDRAGRVTAAFQSRSRETWRIEAGEVSSSISVAPDRALIERARRMLADAGYWGLAQLDFIEQGGEAKLIDVNPRFYGSMPLASACGVNLPAAWHAVALGREQPAVTSYRVGVSYRWLEADVAAFLSGYRRRLLRRAPRPCAGAMWAHDDPAASGLLALEAAVMRVRARLPGAERMLITAR